MEILAAVDRRGDGHAVLETAGALGALTGVDVEALHVVEDEREDTKWLNRELGVPVRLVSGAPARTIVHELNEDDDVMMGVIGEGPARRGINRVGGVTLDVIVHAAKPVVVVPPEPLLASANVPAKVVVPLDGTAATAEALKATLGRFADRGVEIVGLHIFDATTGPRYWDHFYYDFPDWCQKFIRKNCAVRDVRLEIGRGSVAAGILNLAAAERASLIAIAWSQDLAYGHAPIVTDVLVSSRRPVLLMPVAAAARDSLSLAGASRS